MSKAPGGAGGHAGGLRLFSRDEVLDRIAREFVRKDKHYIATRDHWRGELDDLNEKLSKVQSSHRPMECSSQHSLEAGWLIEYTDEWDRADKVLTELKDSLGDTSPLRLEQDDEGSWGPCDHAWYRKLEPTVDVLQEDRVVGKVLKPLKFMDRLKDIDAVLTRLQELRTSDIFKTGRNNRDEQGAMLTALSQMAFKDKFRTIFHDHPELCFDMSKPYVATYTQYLWDLQDCKTGFWGPTYNFVDEVATVQDLSYTFHVIHYYGQGQDYAGRPEIPNLDKIATTTLAIKDHTYPNGWRKPNGDLQDHHNFDIVTIFSRCWKATPPDLQAKIAPEIQELVKWCATKSLHGNHFGAAPSVASYYYGVRFLDEVGLWEESKRFWRTGPIPLPGGLMADKIRNDLRKGFALVRDNSEYSETIAEILGS